MSSRGGRHRSRSGRPADQRLAEAAASSPITTWPARSAELDAVLKERIAEVFAKTTPEEVFTLLLRAPRDSQNELKFVLRLPRSTRKLNRGMASALLSMLQNQGTPTIAIHLVSGFVRSFEGPGLDRAQWTRLLTGGLDEVAAFAASNPVLCQAMGKLARFPAVSHAHALFVVALSSPDWLPAVSLLAFEDGEVEAAYRSLREEQEDLPIAVRSFDDLVQVVTTESKEPEAVDSEDDLQVLRLDADTLDWEETAAAAARVTELLEAGEAPELTETELLTDFVRRVHDLCDRLSVVTQSSVESSADGIASALDALETEAAELWRIEALVTATAPDQLGGQMEQVRALAQTALAGDGPAEIVAGLAALAELAEIGRNPAGGTDFATITTLLEVIREGLPPETHRLIDAAHYGHLQLAPQAAEIASGSSGDNDATDVAPAAADGPDSGSELAGGELSGGRDDHPETDTATSVDEGLGASTADDFDLEDFDRFVRGSRPEAERSKDDIGAGRHEDSSDVADPPEDSADDHEVLHRAETQLLSARRFGLASLLHRTPAHAAARRLAAYQAYLTSPTGDLASAFAEDQPLITRDALSSDQSGQLLAWAAAARVSILAPASAAAQVLLELARRVDDYPGLKEFGSELATASLNGAIAVTDRGERLEAEQQALANVQDAVRAAEDLFAVAPQRSVKYAPANNVYKRWMSAEGVLGTLLTAVIANDALTARQVQTTIVELRRTADRLIDDTYTMVSSDRFRARRIEAGARQTLIKRMDEVLTIAGSWAASATAAADLHEQSRTDGWSQRPLEKLRSTLANLRGRVDDDISRLEAECDETTSEGRYAAASVVAAGRMLSDTFAAIEGRPPTGKEPSRAWAVRSELLTLDLALEPRTLQLMESVGGPTDRGSLEQNSAVLLAGRRRAELDELYQIRSGRNEHDLTEVVVAEAQRSHPEIGSLLLVQREADVSTTQTTVEAELKAAFDNVNSRRRDETLPESVWSTLLADLESLRQPGRRDFATIRATIAATAALVDKHRSNLVDQERERIEVKAKEDPRVALHRDKLLAIIERGDVTGAEEYLERLASEQDMPTERADDYHLQRFFPAVPDLVCANPRILEDLRTTFAGRAPASEAVQQLFSIAERDPAQDTATGRSTAEIALGAWKAVAETGRGGKSKAAHTTSAIRSILGALGLEFQGDCELDKPLDDRRFGRVRSLDGARKAMTPALGSHVGGPGNDSLQILLVWKAVSPATILDWLDGRENTVLVLYLAGTLSSQQRRMLATAARGRPNPIAVVVDAAVLAYLVCQPDPSRSTLAFVTLPFTAASPYWESPGDTPPEMFYGRVDELREVRNLQGSSFVSGGRQLGKSALLRAARRTFDNGSNRRAFLVDIRREGADRNPEDIWPQVAAEMRSAEIGHSPVDPGSATAESVIRTISDWLEEDSDRSLLILLDEADNFLQADAVDNAFDNVGACKRLMEQKDHRVKFVFAGLHRTSRFSSLSNQPLAHLGEPIVVGPLRAQAAQDLITRPMAAMGFTFEEAPAQTARILAATNSVPSLLQLFGRALIEDLIQREVGSGPPQPVSDEDISRVLDNQELADLFRTKYALTLNLDHRYQVIVHAIALAAHEHGIDEGLRLADLADECRQYWPTGFADLPIDYLHGLVTECRDLGLLTLDNGRYRMRTPYVLRLLGTADDIAEVLYDAENRLTLPSSLDAGSYREPIPDTSLHSPLTTRQVGQLFKKAGATHLIVGTAALGADRTSVFLQKYHDRGRAGAYDVQSVAAGTAESMLSAAGRISRPTMLLVNLHEATAAQAATVLKATRDAHAATRKGLILVVVLTPNALPSWLHEDDQLVALGRVDKPGIALWCDESNATFSTSDERDDLLAATGGWPTLVEFVLNGLTDGRPLSPVQGLTRLREHLGDPAGAKDLVVKCGLGADTQVSTALAAVFAAAAILADNDPTRRDDLADLISEDPEVTALVTQAGLDSVADVLRALEIVGAILPVDGDADLVTTEPVLTVAHRVVDGIGVGA
ncbi:ATP-binding protein [Kribbella sp. NPDC056861]|uniref:ATP-binding protein n=1 Tax=Kribbella sp. NPDC056861 TaxID=3154857 RepID=UPI00341E18B0